MTRPFRAKRPDQLAQWRMLLTCGQDFFNDLAHLGLDRRTVTRAAIRKAWVDYGAEIMRDWVPDPKARLQPWGLEQFGEPP
jgi:hypothetical protein